MIPRTGARNFALDTFANALGALLAAAVIYLGGVLVGAFTFEALYTALVGLAAALAGGVLGYIAYRHATRPLTEAEAAELERILEKAKQLASTPDNS